MKTSLKLALPLFLVVLSVTLSAQRGRGGSSRDMAGVPPTLLTEYDNAEYGLKFPAPPDLSIFTPQHPGNFRSMFAERRIIYLADLMGTSAGVTVRFLPTATDADLANFKTAMETNPPQAKLPEYKKISVNTIKIGAGGDKEAVEYIYSAKEKDVTTTTRQVVFVHKGKGFIFSCVATEKEFAAVNKKSFQPLFSSIEFR